MSWMFKGPWTVLGGTRNRICLRPLPGSPVDGEICMDEADKLFKVWNEEAGRWIILSEASDTRQLMFQTIGQMNYDQYLYSGVHLTNLGDRPSGDSSNGGRYSNASPMISPIAGEVFEVSAAFRGVAQSTGTPASIVSVYLELWNVGMNGSEGTKLGDIIIPIDSSTYTIGQWWNSSVVTAFEGGNALASPIAVGKGQLLGVKFKRYTQNDRAVAVENATIIIGIRPQ